jgi:dTDP-4-dehydrorhamnose reductase
MKILLFGKDGQVGWELQRALSVLGELVALDRHGRDGLCGDLADVQGLAETVHRVQPDIIVNAAAYTAVDKAESEPDLAHLINATAPGVLAAEAARIGAWLMHYSTDYVFDGSGDLPWCEADTPAPLNVYGHSKWLGEQAIQNSGCKHLIFRTSWVYATRGGNFAKTMLRLAQEREELKVIDDQWGAPTGADLLADVTAHALRAVMGNGAIANPRPELQGLYHLAASGVTTWFEYAQKVIDYSVRVQPALKIVAKKITPIPTAAYLTPAQRPHNSRLNTAKLQHAFGLSLPHWQMGVERMVREIL